MASSEKDLADILKSFIREELIPKSKQLKSLSASHTVVEVYDAILCFLDTVSASGTYEYGKLKNKFIFAIGLLKDGMPQAKTGLNKDLLIVTVDILCKLTNSVWEKVFIGIFDIKEGTPEERIVDRWLKQSVSFAEKKVHEGKIKILGTNIPYRELKLICKMDLKAVQFTAGGSSFTGRKRM